MITGQIPFASLVTFAKTYGIDDLIEFDAFAQIVRRLDASEVKRINETKPPPKKPT